jgi:D-3-phosphoglycerate dehydrogenase
MRLAILDDYQHAALVLADWSSLHERCEVVTFHQHLGDESTVIDALKDYTIVCCMRERTPFPAAVLEKLPKLKLLVTTGAKNSAIDLKAAKQCGITVCGTQSPGHAAAELAWALIMSLAKNIHIENQAIRQHQWQTTMGTDLKGQTLGILGLGRHGANMARFAQAFGMRCMAWSQNLTKEHCDALGVTYVDKETFFRTADFITIHLKMGQRNRGLITEQELSLMKPSAFLVNTSRGPIVDENALMASLRNRQIAGAGLDVYEQEPLPKDYPLLDFNNVLLMPHMGYVTRQTYDVFYTQTIEAVEAWLDGDAIRQL